MQTNNWTSRHLTQLIKEVVNNSPDPLTPTDVCRILWTDFTSVQRELVIKKLYNLHTSFKIERVRKGNFSTEPIYKKVEGPTPRQLPIPFTTPKPEEAYKVFGRLVELRKDQNNPSNLLAVFEIDGLKITKI